MMIEGAPTLEFILGSAWGLVSVLLLWIYICNNQTYRDRRRILDYNIYMADKHGPILGRMMLSEFSLVSYNHHLLWRVLLLDPMMLYPPQLRPMGDEEER